MKAKHLLLALVLATPVSANVALAQAPVFQWDETVFTQLDTDRDGKISEAEYRVFMEHAFDKLNTQRTGALTREEAAPVFTATEFDLVDTDKNGTISHEEFMTAVMNDFHRQDRNGDGFLTR
ncbi:EF-hand domain-containing protein [Kerstersia sp.]|uniref:EF-hand domain-containing protein n=1 Tax=Kerstersia sp. TaxID=1930783 RepID=UPI003F8F4572